jgi:mRNA-degrading endonuclease RelE of RelBE toxin-antitoxin system
MLAGMHGVWRVRVAKDYRIVYQVDDGLLAGMHGVWRVRVAKDYRIVYQVDDGLLVILVVDAGHRREIYR